MSQNESNLPRRDFLKKTILAATVVPLAGQIFGARYVRAQDDLKMLSPDEPAAKALKYVTDASKAEAAQKGQRCDTCQLYTQVGTKDDKKVGTCTLFLNPTKRHVYAQGWCSAWVAKPS